MVSALNWWIFSTFSINSFQNNMLLTSILKTVEYNNKYSNFHKNIDDLHVENLKVAPCKFAAQFYVKICSLPLPELFQNADYCMVYWDRSLLLLCNFNILYKYLMFCKLLFRLKFWLYPYSTRTILCSDLQSSENWETKPLDSCQAVFRLFWRYYLTILSHNQSENVVNNEPVKVNIHFLPSNF